MSPGDADERRGISPILSLIAFLPLVGALFIMSVRGDEEVVASNARWAALWTSLIVFGLSLVLWVDFDPSSSDFQFRETLNWLPAWGITYRMGVDGISVLLCSYQPRDTDLHSCELAGDHEPGAEIQLAFLVLETMMVGMFCALDAVLFYIFFEGVLIPMYLIIGVWVGREGFMPRLNSSSSPSLVRS